MILIKTSVLVVEWAWGETSKNIFKFDWGQGERPELHSLRRQQDRPWNGNSKNFYSSVLSFIQLPDRKLFPASFSISFEDWPFILGLLDAFPFVALPQHFSYLNWSSWAHKFLFLSWSASLTRHCGTQPAYSDSRPKHDIS